MWTEEAKAEWKAGASRFNSSDQAKMYQEIEYWASAIGPNLGMQNKRFPKDPNARVWCEVTAANHQVVRVTWDS